jgi:hypothetical protein
MIRKLSTLSRFRIWLHLRFWKGRVEDLLNQLLEIPQSSRILLLLQRSPSLGSKQRDPRLKSSRLLPKIRLLRQQLRAKLSRNWYHHLQRRISLWWWRKKSLKLNLMNLNSIRRNQLKRLRASLQLKRFRARFYPHHQRILMGNHWHHQMEPIWKLIKRWMLILLREAQSKNSRSHQLIKIQILLLQL